VPFVIGWEGSLAPEFQIPEFQLDNARYVEWPPLKRPKSSPENISFRIAQPSRNLASLGSNPLAIHNPVKNAFLPTNFGVSIP